MLTKSFTDPYLSIENYTRILSSPGYLKVIGRTLAIAAGSSLLALFIGYPIAYVIATTRRTGLGRFLIFCIVAPYLTSILVRTFAWYVLLGRVGIVNDGLALFGIERQDMLFNSAAVVIGLTHYLLPLMILPLVTVMKGIDRSLPLAAASLGAGPATAFVRVYVPGTFRGIEIGLVLCFIYGVGAFITPALLGGGAGRMFGVLIQNAVDVQGDFGLASAASVILATAVVLIFLLYRYGYSGNISALATPAAQGEVSKEMTLARRSGHFARYPAKLAQFVDRIGLSRVRSLPEIYAIVAALLILLPQMIAIPVSLSSTRSLVFPPPGWSLQWYRGFLEPQWWHPLQTSIVIGLSVTVISTLLGSLAAIGVVRGLKSGAASGVGLVLLFPLLFPTVIAAAAFFVVFVDIGLTDSALGILLAHSTIAMPLVFAIVSANLRTLSPIYERAAASLGAGWWMQLRRVLIPLLATSIGTAAFFAFLSSFDEASIAIFLSGVHVKTLPRRMYEALSLESDPTIGVVAVLTMAISALALLGLTTIRRLRKNQETPND